MKRWLSKAEVTLGNHSDRLNAINIFPVADGDTGTNLYQTVRAAAQGIQECPETTDLGVLINRAGRAAMENARGNSGTLFSVFLGAFAEPLHGHIRLSASVLATALNRAQIRAWSALSDPVPGTMLSVLEAAASAAADADAAQNGDDSNHALSIALDAAVDAALTAVVQTENELEALNAAKIVDAGGVGMLLILDALRSTILGVGLQDDLLENLHGYNTDYPHIHNQMPDDDGTEVMCTIDLSPLDAATLRLRLDEMGDSVIMSPVGESDAQTDNYRWRVHVHVADPGPALALINSLGTPANVTLTQLAGADSDSGHAGGDSSV
ncbi:DAK2 domain-containing protein [Pseudarthrobacter sp. J1738]|uniref:DAK2 domain-containing protein n=1 Tax=Pseudarthrobacter sp. J1738 TaxID=3420446 RepID=UPI003D29BD02